MRKINWRRICDRLEFDLSQYGHLFGKYLAKIGVKVPALAANI
jgi:hypothetical protein